MGSMVFAGPGSGPPVLVEDAKAEAAKAEPVEAPATAAAPAAPVRKTRAEIAKGKVEG